MWCQRSQHRVVPAWASQQCGSAFPAQQGFRGRTGHESRSRRPSRPGPQGAHGRPPCRPTLGARVAATGNGVEVGPRGLDRRPGDHGGVLRTARDHPQSGFGGLRRPGVDGAATRRPGRGAAYVGAFVDPTGTALSSSDPTGGTASLPAELGSLPDFNQRVGHAPSILSTFQDWDQSADVAGLDSVAATGAIPMVTWSCGDSDANVVAGLDDATVTAEAQALGGHGRSDPPPLVPRSESDGCPHHGILLGVGRSIRVHRGVSAHQNPVQRSGRDQRGVRVVRRHLEQRRTPGSRTTTPVGTPSTGSGPTATRPRARILRRRRSPRSSGHGIRPSRPPESP